MKIFLLFFLRKTGQEIVNIYQDSWVFDKSKSFSRIIITKYAYYSVTHATLKYQSVVVDDGVFVVFVFDDVFAVVVVTVVLFYFYVHREAYLLPGKHNYTWTIKHSDPITAKQAIRRLSTYDIYLSRLDR